MPEQISLPWRDPHLAALHFQPEQLSRARELKGLSKSALSQLIGKTPSAITQFEQGLIKPDAQTVARCALALGLPVEFLARQPLAPKMPMQDCHFRSLRSVSQYLRRQALRTGEIVHELTLLLEQAGVRFAPEQLSALKCDAQSADEIELAATETRRAWGLGAAPVQNLLPLLENRGIRVLPLADSCADVDAFSIWHQGQAFMLLAMQKSSSRAHFDAAHELGHLILHEDVTPADPEIEQQANQFASAFLLPRDAFLQECPKRWNLDIFLALKRRWRVSLRALVYRAHSLGCLSQASYRRAYVELNRLYGQHEADEWPLQRPQALSAALELVQQELPLARLAEQLGLRPTHLQQLLQPLLQEGTER